MLLFLLKGSDMFAHWRIILSIVLLIVGSAVSMQAVAGTHSTPATNSCQTDDQPYPVYPFPGDSGYPAPSSNCVFLPAINYLSAPSPTPTLTPTPLPTPTPTPEPTPTATAEPYPAP
jgi:hypothetical protein